jgi:hypothetical protein
LQYCLQLREDSCENAEPNPFNKDYRTIVTHLTYV